VTAMGVLSPLRGPSSGRLYISAKGRVKRAGGPADERDEDAGRDVRGRRVAGGWPRRHRRRAGAGWPRGERDRGPRGTRGRARGAVGIITPWNWPYTMPAELIAPALACGNAVVWTPAPTTAVCAEALARCVADADLPPGVFNLVTGPGPEVGDEIARNPGTAG